MARARKVVFFGNCQAQGLAKVYATHFGRRMGDEVAYADSQNVLTDADFAARTLGEADVVVNQVFDFETKLSADGLPAGCVSFRFPAVVAGFYFPYASQPHILTPEGMRDPPYPAQLGDRYLNGLIAKNIEPEAGVAQYLSLDVAHAANLDRLYELFMDRQRKRDEQSGCDVAATLIQRFREEPLFLTPDHPSLTIFNVIARHAFHLLGVAPDAIEAALALQMAAPFPPSALPIHPGVIAHFGLKFADAETRYPFLDEGRFTFEEFALRYMRYEWNSALHSAIHDPWPPHQRIALLKKGLRDSPNSAFGWRVLGDTLLQVGQLDQAAQAALCGLQVDANYPDLCALMYRLELARDNIPAAVAVARQAAERFPNHPWTFRMLADAGERIGDADLALEGARRLVELEDGDSEAHRLFDSARIRATGPHQALAKASELESAGQHDQALQMLNLISLAAPGDGQLRARMGDLSLRIGEYGAAETHFRNAMAAGVEDARILNGLATSLLFQNRLDECEAVIVPLAAREDNPHTYSTLAHLEICRGNLALAEAILRQAISLDPTLPGLYNTLADVYWKMERAQDAVAQLDRILELGVEDPGVYAKIGVFESRNGNLARGEDMLRRAMKIDASNRNVRFELANTLLLQGKSEEAERIKAALRAEAA